MKFCVSEEDAKTKWCPMAGESRFQRQSEDCMGSHCMAWRWVKTHIADDNGDLSIESDDTHGYCGLAGNPQVRS